MRSPVMGLRPWMKIVLVLELLLGVAPLSAYYVYLFPVNLFWVRESAAVTFRGTADAFTAGIAVLLVAGGIGLACLWITMIRRLTGRGAPGRIVLSGLVLGLAVAFAALAVVSVLEALWFEYYVYGGPAVVAVHQICWRR